MNRPTPEQCNQRARLPDYEGCPAHAMWYPQIGGYSGAAIIIFTNKGVDACFDLALFHDGEFPTEEIHTWLHHCSPAQFVDFGNAILQLQKD